jgi:hypothetical protein
VTAPATTQALTTTEDQPSAPTPPRTQTPAEIIQSVTNAAGAQNRTEFHVSDGMDEGETRDPA